MPERLFRHPDLLLAVPADAPPTAIRDVQNWYAEFKDQQSPR
jgi:hypothetical protein